VTAVNTDIRRVLAGALNTPGQSICPDHTLW